MQRERERFPGLYTHKMVTKTVEESSAVFSAQPTLLLRAPAAAVATERETGGAAAGPAGRGPAAAPGRVLAAGHSNIGAGQQMAAPAGRQPET